MTLTRQQREALKRVYDRDTDTPLKVMRTYRQFRSTVLPGPGCIMVRWNVMWLGIEPDGYTHS